MKHLIIAEWRKLSRRPLPWVVLGIVIASVVAVVLGGALLAISNVITVYDENDNATNAAAILPSFTLPGAIPMTLSVVRQVGTWLLIIFVAISIGMEESYGTLRIMLSTGLDRTRYLLAKLIVLIGFTIFIAVAGFATGCISALAVGALSPTTITPEPVEGSVFWMSLTMLVRTIGILCLPVVLAFTITVLSRSQTLGLSITLGYFIFDILVSSVSAFMGNAGEIVRTLLIGSSSTAIMQLNRLGQPMTLTESWSTVAPNVLVLTTYVVILLFGCRYVFTHRDITSGTSS